MPVNILNLQGLHVTDFKEAETEYHIKAEPAAISRLCPHCGRSHDTIMHAQKTLFVRDLPSHGKSVAIHLDAPRLLCKQCNKTFTATVPEVDIARQMTERLAHWIGRQSLEYTYAEIAKQVNVDEKTVRNIFDEYVAGLEKQFKRETPPWLGIDEIKLGRFRAVFTNIYGHALVDKFHVVSKANVSLDAVRRGVGKADQKRHEKGLKRAHKLFTKRHGDLSEEQYITVSGWQNSFPLLGAAYDLKERLFRIYDVSTKEEAWAEYLRWESSIPPELEKPFRPVKTAFRN